MRFVQLADVHIDSATRLRRVGLSEAGRNTLRADLRAAFSRACDLAAERDAGCVLLAGDLFDYESADHDLKAFIADCFRRIDPIRVFVTPGNHDSLMARSPYFGEWPANVHIFTEPRFVTVAAPELGASVTGIAHAHRGITDRLSSLGATPTGGCDLLLFHGSRDGYRPTDKENVIPFSDAELLESGFTYTAIGHYHSFAAISQDAAVKAAYSGCLQGRGLDETGPKYLLVGEIDTGGRVTLEPVEVASRRFVTADVNLTGASDSDAVLARIDSAIRASEARDVDIVCVNLRGALAPGVRIDTTPIESSGSWFHVWVNRSGLVDDYHIESILSDSSAEPLRSAFVRRLVEMGEHEQDAARKATLRDAVYYGLAALDGRPLEPRDED